MIRFSTGLFVAIIFISQLIAYAALGKPPGKVFKKRHYNSAQSEGIIGVTVESPIDNAVDNIFHVNIDVAVRKDDKMWLVYDLEGVQDHTSVSRSINDQ